MKPELERVDIKEVDSFIKGETRLNVQPVWKNVDRPMSSSYGFSLKHRKLAERFKKAFEAGAIYVGLKLCKDIEGKTFASYNLIILMRRCSAELNRLGY